LLLDDVLSELDSARRSALTEGLPSTGQAVITATSAAALPHQPDQLLEVTPGKVRAA
jgi:recombinational DNA repair ATPase RecF